MYKMIDVYDTPHEILSTNISTYEDARNIALKRIEETDEECDIIFAPVTPDDVDPFFESKIIDAISRAYDIYEADLTMMEMRGNYI